MFKKTFSLLTLGALLFTTNAPIVDAIPNPQDPSTEAIITIEADGIVPFDGSDGGGNDSSATNDLVRNFDIITYNVEVSLNDADDTNVQAVITLNSDASWEALAPECKTIAQGFNTISPDSNLQDNDGDGLNETMVCNLGDHTEGTKLLIKPTAKAVGNNGDMVAAQVLSTSDNNVNTSGMAGTQGDGPIETEITAGFGINLDKSVQSLPDEDEIDYNPTYQAENSIVPGSPEGKVIDWHIRLGYNSGSEFIQDDGSGNQSFTLTDTWVGTHSLGTPEGDNANSDYDDQIVMLGTISGNPADNCELINAGGGSVACTQAGPGEPITISLTGVPVNQQPLAKVHLKMFVPYPDVFPAAAVETYNIDNTVELTGWGGTGTMVTSATGATDAGPEVASEDYLLSDAVVAPGSFLMKTFDGFSVAKSGQRAAARGETVATTLYLNPGNGKFDRTVGICDTLDTSVFEFSGHDGAGQMDGLYHGRAILGDYEVPGIPSETLHQSFNPVIRASSRTIGGGTSTKILDGSLYGVIIEYSDTDYTVTGDDHWTATCEDTVGGWTTDYTTFPGGAADVVRVRAIYDRDWSELAPNIHPLADRSVTYFSFNLTIKDTAPIGSHLPNTASTYRDTTPWNDTWLGTTTAESTHRMLNVEDDDTNALYSFNIQNADRVLVLPASMGITKVSNEGSALEPGDTASFTIDPRTSGSNADAVEMTFTDTLPGELAYVSDTCAADYAAVGLTCTVVVSGQTVTWTVPGYQVGDNLPAFELITEVVNGTESGTYTNEVEISSDFATFTDDSHCASAVDTSGVNDATSISRCESAFIKPHSDTASILVVTPSGYKVEKERNQTVTEPFTDFENTLTYINLGGSAIGEGHIIDILPHNGDGEESTLRHNSDTPTNPNTSTQTAAVGANFYGIIPSAAGETFEYSADPYASIDHRPCHPSNWPVGDVLGGGNTTLDNICSQGLIDPSTDVPTAAIAGTGTTTWGALPANIYDVKAIRIATPAFPAGDPQREITLEMNSAASIDGDLFCNNFGANSDIVTLDVISNDVCIPVVAGSIGDYVWLDTNQDGTQDANESPLPNITIKLLDGTGNPIHVDPTTGAILDAADPNSVPYTTQTDADGAYLFENLPSGDYQVMVDTNTLPAGSVQTYDYDGAGDDMSAITLNGPNTDPNLTDVDDNDEQDFGYYYNFDLALKKEVTSEGPYYPGDNITYAITIYNQGTVDATDITITDQLPTGLTLNDSSWTDIGNNQSTYTVASLPAGQEIAIPFTATINPDATGDLINVAEISDAKDGDGNDVTDIDSTPDTDPDNDTQEDDTTDNSNGDEDDNDPSGITISAPLGSIGNYVWIDTNEDGIQDADEQPLANVTVTLTLPDGTTQTTQTDANGQYLFSDLPPGDYIITITPPEGYTQTYDYDGGGDLTSTYTLGSGENNEEQDFGLAPPSGFTGEIGNRIYYDANQNCEHDPDEGIEDVTVELTWAGPDNEFGTDDDQEWETKTDKHGEYLFTNLPPGKYKVEVDEDDKDLDGYTLFSDPDQKCSENHNRANGIDQINLTLGETYYDADFGYIKDEEKEELVKTGTNMPLYALGAFIATLMATAIHMRRRKLQRQEM